MIYEHREQRRDDAGEGKLLTFPPGLSDNPTSRVIREQVGEMDKRSEDLALQAFLFTLASDFFLHSVKSYDIGPLALLTSEGKCAAGFYRPLNPLPRPGMNTRPLGPVASH
jgi:hypothetical protein